MFVGKQVAVSEGRVRGNDGGHDDECWCKVQAAR